MQFGRFQIDSKRSAINFQCSLVGTGIYISFNVSQIILVVSCTIVPTVVSPLAKYNERDTNVHPVAKCHAVFYPIYKNVGSAVHFHNLPEKPQDETTDETIENTEICDGLTNSSYSDQSSELQPPPLPTSPTLEAPFLSPSASPASPVLSQQINHPEEQFSSRNKKNLKFKNKSAVEADNCVAEYFKAKKARLEANLVTNSYNSENKEALKMFLLSLIPKVEHFSKDQIKLFKRKIFSVIDEISSQSSSTFSSPSTTSFPSTHTSQSATSYTSGSTTSNALEYYSNFSGTVENYVEECESSFTPL
ncbi:hypothetical protein QTP88_019419 [Uroleucon formosanum]